MSDTTDDLLARFESVVARLEQAAPPEIGATAVNPDGTPGAVASGELIESAWGNAVVSTVMRSVGCSYFQGGQPLTSGQSTVILWAAQNYDSGSPPLGAAGGSTFTIPPNLAGTWSLVCNVRSDPGAPTADCDLTLNTSPALQVQPAVYLPSGKRSVALTWVGRATAGATFSWTFYNGHSGVLTVAAQMEARWIGF